MKKLLWDRGKIEICQKRLKSLLPSTPNLGQSPLGWAAQNGHSACLETLIKQGANVNLSSENHSLWAFINKPFFSNTALILAIEQDHVECVNILISAGADVNKPNGSGEGALMIAAHNGSDTYVERLIKAGADVNKSPGSPITPLVAAVSSGSPITPMVAKTNSKMQFFLP